MGTAGSQCLHPNGEEVPESLQQEDAKTAINIFKHSNSINPTLLLEDCGSYTECDGESNACHKDHCHFKPCFKAFGLKSSVDIAIAVVRHGERLDMIDKPAWFKSELGRAYPFDCPLTENGKVQATRVGERLAETNKRIRFNSVVTSPFIRCVQTAVQICRVLQLPLCIDAALGEIYGPHCFGPWAPPGPKRRLPNEVLAWVPDDIELVGPNVDLGAARTKDFMGHAPVWPETVADARVRMVARVEKYAARAAKLGGAGFVLVTHGDCVAACLALTLTGLGLNLSPQRIHYCGTVLLMKNTTSGSNPAQIRLMEEDSNWKCQYTDIDVVGMSDDSKAGPLDPRPLSEEAFDVAEKREQEANHEVDEEMSGGLEDVQPVQRRTSTHFFRDLQDRSKDILEFDASLDFNFVDLFPRFPRGRTLSSDDELGSWLT